MPIYRMKLHKTYFERGFFNVPVAFDRFVGPGGSAVSLILEGGALLDGRINRSSNKNRTARVHGGRRLRQWFQSNFKLKEEVDVEFLSPTVLRIQPPAGVGLFRRYDWHRLNQPQIIKYAEYLVKMEFTLWGLDVFSSEVGDHAIDLIVRRDQERYCELQVQAVRGFNYLAFPKASFHPHKNLYAAIVVLELYQPPRLYLIPSSAWRKPDELLVSRDHKGKMRDPEWGINLSLKNLPLLEEYEFDKAVRALMAPARGS
ncbi:MAG: hypothetical protein PVF70_10490 [Anaerolineales bacterium]